ncbi:MAG: SMC-Scp complex subunit ScpB [Phycisphaeraceae bacterium]
MSNDAQTSAGVREEVREAGDVHAQGGGVPIPDDLPARVEAAVLISDRAISANRLAEALGGIPAAAVREAIEALNEEYGRTGRSFRIEEVAGGYQVLTLPQYADVLDALHKGKSSDKLSAAAVETLAIVAYKQPIIRAEIESIRGVACGEVLRSLLEKRLVKVVGRAEEIGRPMLYGTTKRFLEVFGLSSVKDLPQSEEPRP